MIEVPDSAIDRIINMLRGVELKPSQSRKLIQHINKRTRIPDKVTLLGGSQHGRVVDWYAPFGAYQCFQQAPRLTADFYRGDALSEQGPAYNVEVYERVGIDQDRAILSSIRQRYGDDIKLGLSINYAL